MPKQNAGSPRATAPRENSKPRQPSKNLESQQQEARQDLPNVADLLMEPVPFKVGGRIRSVPWFEAYIRATRERALEGDFQAGKVIITLAKEAQLLKPLPGNGSFHFTLNLGRPRNPFQTDGAAESMDHKPEFASDPGNERH
jgi:hypothetical protein